MPWLDSIPVEFARCRQEEVVYRCLDVIGACEAPTTEEVLSRQEQMVVAQRLVYAA